MPERSRRSLRRSHIDCVMHVSTVGQLFVFIACLLCWSDTVEIQQRSRSSPKQGRTNSSRSRSSRMPPSLPFVTNSSQDSVYEIVTMTTTPTSPGAGRQSRPFEVLHPRLPDVSIECVALRSKRYISDGFCTSIKPVSDVVCTGTCLPIRDLPWYAEFIKVWSRQKTLQYRCVDDLVRVRKVTFLCKNGESRTYDIRVVRSCKCKRYIRGQNESSSSSSKKNKNNSN